MLGTVSLRRPRPSRTARCGTVATTRLAVVLVAQKRARPGWPSDERGCASERQYLRRLWPVDRLATHQVPIRGLFKSPSLAPSGLEVCMCGVLSLRRLRPAPPGPGGPSGWWHVEASASGGAASAAEPSPTWVRYPYDRSNWHHDRCHDRRCLAIHQAGGPCPCGKHVRHGSHCRSPCGRHCQLLCAGDGP